jgi:hypothetical protein
VRLAITEGYDDRRIALHAGPRLNAAMRVWPLGAVCATLAAFAGGAGASTTAFTLTFDGKHVEDTSLPGGIRHEGRFTASAPACPAGTAADVEDVVVEPLTVLRQFTCDDGTGTFTVLIPGARSEHGGSGTWQIVRGTGRYETLRGMGRYTSVILSGAQEDFLSIVYRATWTGVADFDVTPPAVKPAAKATRLVTPKGAYTLKVSLAMPQDAGSRISYTAAVTAGRFDLLVRFGATSTGRAGFTARIKPPSTARRVRLHVVANDPVGNTGATDMSVALPRR